MSAPIIVVSIAISRPRRDPCDHYMGVVILVLICSIQRGRQEVDIGRSGAAGPFLTAQGALAGHAAVTAGFIERAAGWHCPALRRRSVAVLIPQEAALAIWIEALSQIPGDLHAIDGEPLPLLAERAIAGFQVRPSPIYRASLRQTQAL